MIHSNSKIPCLLVDYGIHKECNLACNYCRNASITNRDNRKKSQERLKMYMEGLSNTSKYVNAVMFKTSGWGEITTLQNYIQLFQYAKDLGYEVLQLITNGVCVFTESELLELQNLGNFTLQMSIDGLNHSENKYRFHGNPQLLKRFFTNLHLASGLGIPIEINTVLTDANTASLRIFLDGLLSLHAKYKTTIVCVPRGVKLKSHLKIQNLMPNNTMIDELEKTILDSYSTYKSVLPPKLYLTSLINFLHTGQRNWICYDTLVRINIGASGDIVVHTKSGKKLLGNILGSDYERSFQNRYYFHSLNGDSNYQMKMNQFDIHNLYLGGRITLSEIARIPSCSNSISQNRLEYLRSLILDAQVFSR